MMSIVRLAMAAGCLVLLGQAPLAAQPARDQDRDRTQLQDQDRIFGSQLMTEQERQQYRERMRNARTEQERERYRLEHHGRMQARARERGLTLPDDPPRQGGMGGAPGGGPGAGAGGGGRR